MPWSFSIGTALSNGSIASRLISELQKIEGIDNVTKGLMSCTCSTPVASSQEAEVGQPAGSHSTLPTESSTPPSPERSLAQVSENIGAASKCASEKSLAKTHTALMLRRKSHWDPAAALLSYVALLDKGASSEGVAWAVKTLSLKP